MGGQFLDLLRLRALGPTSEMVELDGPLRYRSAAGLELTVPTGFVTDLASVPAWLRMVAPPWPQSARAGVLHDCGYRWAEVWELSRPQIDALLYEALRADQTGSLRAWGMWAAVRSFGHAPWASWRATPEGDRNGRPARGERP